MESPKLFRRGEAIFKAGEPAKTVYLVQSGLVTLSVDRGGKAVEVAQIGVGQLLGEEALWGNARWSVTAIANNDVRATPADIQTVFKMMSAGSPLIKIFLKGLIDKQRGWWTTLMQTKADSDAVPCPPARVTQLFAVLHRVASYNGTVKKGATVVVWPTFKKYCQRTFLESPVRLEAAVLILVKLGAARLEMIPCETDPEAPDELGFVHFTDLDRVKAFYEFYRSYYHARTKAGPLPTPSQSHLEILHELEEWNRTGRVTMSLAEGAEGKAA